ncbi:MAG TPA: ABC transporter permease [Vicinamibacterales bacterium]|nr:ABC transporter permease [Vicinamibacterales bacterium]
MWSELRYAIRSLLKAPEFTLVATAIIAIGIGANTAVFSIVDAALLRPLPFKNSGRLFTLSGSNPKRAIRDGPFSYPSFVELAARDSMLSGLAAIANEPFNETDGDRPEQLPGARVSASFFEVIGVQAALGRTFAPAENKTGAAAVAVIGRGYWRRRFGGAESAIGVTLALNGTPYTVIGALGIDLPPPFDDVDVWAPRVDEITGFPRNLIDGGLGYLTAVARIAPGVRVEQAQSEVDAIAHAYARANPTNTDADPDASLHLTPIRERTAGSARSPLLVLMGAVGLVLLIACANVANLLLVRATARSHETAVRLALGASRWDLTRWMCSESLLLSLSGGILGVLLAFWSVDLAASTLRGLPRGSEIAIDGRVLAFSLAVSIAAGVVFGTLPLSLAARQSPVDAIKSHSGRGSTATRRGTRNALIVAEVALSLMLLVGAGLLLRGFARLTRVPVGFKADGLLTFRLSLPTSGYSDPAAMRSFFTRLMPRLERMPGVSGAAASMALPPAMTTMAPYVTGDQPLVAIGERPLGQWSAVTPGYFATLGIPIVAGRSLSADDTEQSPLAVVISQGLARRAWPNASPIGRQILVGRFPGFAVVVGVAGDVKNNGLASEPMAEMYTPYPQRPWPAMQFVVRSAGGNPLALVNAVRAAVQEVDRELPITRVETMDASLADSVSTERLLTWLLFAFAAVALLMAAVGLYGVIAYTVTQRTQEIGVRIALGADPSAVVRLVAAEGLRLTAAGMIAGTLAAAVVSRTMRGMLFDVSPADPLTYGAVLVIFTATACAALIVPARRALRVDPLTALRAE